MKKRSQFIIYNLLVFLVLVGCNTDASLQTYFVDHQETPNFISVDIPRSIVTLDETTLTLEQKKAYQSVSRLNFLGYKVDEMGNDNYSAELNKVKDILNNSKYTDLMEFSDSGSRIYVKYLGDEESADELIIFGNSQEMGFGIVRVLGTDMKIEQMATLVGAIKNADFSNSEQLQTIEAFFN
ncbi:DUF4252 domain-containing protein [Bizionia sp. KMM 8389]